MVLVTLQKRGYRTGKKTGLPPPSGLAGTTLSVNHMHVKYKNNPGIENTQQVQGVHHSKRQRTAKSEARRNGRGNWRGTGEAWMRRRAQGGAVVCVKRLLVDNIHLCCNLYCNTTEAARAADDIRLGRFTD